MHDPRPRMAAAAIAAVLLACCGFAGAARAEFTVCNQTIDAVNLAIAKDSKGVFTSEGWWTIGANRCVDVIKEELTNRYIYVYATDVFGQPILAGDFAGVAMCVGPRRFTIEGTESCWQRGFEQARFLEVDTQAMARWTFFIKDPDAGEAAPAR